MKKTFRNILLFVVAAVLITALAGCNQEPAVTGDGALQVNTIRFMPYAYMGESFDLREVLLMEEGVEYSATALYVDISTKTEYALEVDDLYFTPEAIAETVVVITAKRGSETASKVIYIPTTIRAEPLDDLYKSSGTLGGADAGISKDVNIDPLFLKGENSTTSLHVSFNSTDPHPWGNIFLNFHSADAQKYYTDQVWENALITFWVYNPMEKDIEFQLRVVNEEAGIDTDWNTTDGPHRQFAKAGEWTQIFFSLRKIGVTKKVTNTQYVQDYVMLKFRYEDYSTTDAYAMDFYMDDIDVVDGSMYPEIDTKYILSNETLEQGWENMKMDKGWQGVYTEYDYECFTGEGSTCSLKATFLDDKAKTNSFICLSPEVSLDPLPDMTGGKLSGYFKLENVDTKVSVDIINKKWESSNKVDMQLSAVGDGWYYGVVDLESVEVGSGRNDNIIRIRFHFSGVSDASVVYMDTVKFEYKYVNKVLESVAADWINLPTDRGSFYWNVETKYVSNNLKGSNTVRSLYVTAPSDAAGKFTFSTQAAVSAGELSVLPNMTNGTLGAWFYFGKQLPSATMWVSSDNWKRSVDVPFTFTKNGGDGWYYGEAHGSDIRFTESATAANTIRITITIPKGYAVYVDNLHWYPGVENPLYAADVDPSILYDGGDLFAEAYPANGANRGIFDGSGNYSCDTECTNIYDGNEVGKYSVKSWRFGSVMGRENYPEALIDLGRSVNMNGKLLAMDVYCENTKGAVAIYTLHDSSWSYLQASENAANFVQNTVSNKWSTLYYDISKNLKEGKDLSDVRFIKLQFYFDAFDGSEPINVYIDNVRLVSPDQVPPADDVSTDWTNMSQDKGAAFYHVTATNEFSGEYVKGEHSVLSLHIAAPDDAAGVFTFNTEYAFTKGELEKRVNMNDGTLGAWFYFGEQTPAATLRLTEAGWDNSREISFEFGEGEDGWYYGTVDCSKITFPKTFYPGLTIRATITIPAGYDIYVDTMTFTPADIPDPAEPAEDPNDLLGPVKQLEHNVAQWAPAYGLTVKPSTEVIYTEEYDSIRSMSFLATAAANLNGACAQFKLPESKDMTGYNLAFDILYEADTKAQQGIKLRLHSGSDITTDESVRVNPGQWKTVVVNFDDVLIAGKDYKNLNAISFYFDFAANTGVERKIYIDNVRFTKDSETRDDEPAPVDPSEAYDGGDLLADAKLYWYEPTWDGDPAAYDSSAEVCADNEMGAYSVKSWKFYTTQDSFVDGAQLQFPTAFSLVGKDLSFDVKFANANQTLGVALWNGWTALQDDGKSLVTLTGDGSDGWQTFTISAEELYELLQGKTHDQISLIRFYFNMNSGVSGEHAVYIDNLRLTPTDLYETKSDLLANATVDAADWTPENGLSVQKDTENVTGSDSMRSWAFTAEAAANMNAAAKFDLGKNVDMTGKYLVMDVKTANAQSFTVELLDENGNALTSAIQLSAAGGKKWTVALADVTGNVLAEKSLSAVRYVVFVFDCAANTGAERTVNIDNLRLTKAETAETDWIHLPLIAEEGNPNAELSLDAQNLMADGSTASLKFVSPADNVGVVMYDTADIGFTLKHRGTVSAWFYFGDQEPAAALITVDSGMNVSVGASFAFGTGSNGWYEGTVNLAELDYGEGVTPGYIASLVLGIPQSYTVYVDGLIYTDITETADYDMIHIPRSAGTITSNMLCDDMSAQSLYVEAASAAVTVDFTPAEAMSFADGKLTAWFYFGENAPSTVRFAAYDISGNTGYVSFTFGEGVNGWYLGTLDMSNVAPAKQSVLNAVTKFRIQVLKGSNTYIDNLQFVANEVTE